MKNISAVASVALAASLGLAAASVAAEADSSCPSGYFCKRLGDNNQDKDKVSL